MSRSRHHGCGRTCGLCRPHKKWRGNFKEHVKPAVRRHADELSDYTEDTAPSLADRSVSYIDENGPQQPIVCDDL